MDVTHSTASKDAATNAVVDQLDGDVIAIHCAVAASGSDINMSNGLTVASGDTVSCSSLTYAALSA